MQTVKRIVTLTCCIAVCLCMAGNVKAKAASLPEGAEVLSDLLDSIGIQNDLTGIAYAYNSLTEDQKILVAYLMGAWNNVYLCARGFQYNIPDDESSIKAEFIALGRRVLTFALTDYAWKSRINEAFRQYMSAIIIYAKDYASFEDWYIDHKYGGDKTLYIPYSEDAFSAWTVWYNDPSGDGIASFGDVVSEWDSGDFYDLAIYGYPWYNNTMQNTYNNFILTYNPVLYSKSGGRDQVLVSGTFPDSLYILRSADNQYSQFCFGFSDGSSQYTLNFLYIWLDSYDYIHCSFNRDYNIQLWKIIGSIPGTTLANLINTIIKRSPYRIANAFPAGIDSAFYDAYPLINHVFLVDDLNTLSNPTEVYNTDSLNVVAPENPYFIVAPNKRMMLPIWPTADDDPMNLWDNIIDNSIDVDTYEPVSDDDYHTSIVNNNVINNYYVSDTDLINVPVQWFDNPYTQQLGEDALPFIGFAKDCIDTLGNFDIYMYGAIVIGLGGGVVKKLLL